MNGGPLNVLFLCTGNSARSILAEALLDKHGQGRFRAHSAGSFPKGKVHPMALEVLKVHGLAIDRLRSKSWDEFASPGAPPIHFIFTVCDNAAGEVCPVWPGRPMTAHWGIPDPADVEGGGQREAFEAAYRALEKRVARFSSLDLGGLDETTLKAKLREIGDL